MDGLSELELLNDEARNDRHSVAPEVVKGESRHLKLLSSLRYTSGSATGWPAGTGNHGGDLRLFFSTLNLADWKKTAKPSEVTNGKQLDEWPPTHSHRK